MNLRVTLTRGATLPCKLQGVPEEHGNLDVKLRLSFSILKKNAAVPQLGHSVRFTFPPLYVCMHNAPPPHVKLALSHFCTAHAPPLPLDSLLACHPPS